VDHEYKPAIRVFKEEIVRRFNDGTKNSRSFLINEGYLNYLNEEEKQELEKHNVNLARCKQCNDLFEVKYSKIDGKPLILCAKCYFIKLRNLTFDIKY